MRSAILLKSLHLTPKSHSKGRCHLWICKYNKKCIVQIFFIKSFINVVTSSEDTSFNHLLWSVFLSSYIVYNIKNNCNEKTMHIPGYTLETEKSTSTKRVATYVGQIIESHKCSLLLRNLELTQNLIPN